MSPFKRVWPSPEEERTRAWKRYSLLVQCVFFFLTAIAVAASDVFFPGWFVMAGCIVLAEILIHNGQFWRTGIESALWFCGLYAFIFKLPHSGQPEAFLVLAAAAALAGFRLRNALFGTIAMGFVLVYFAEKHWPVLTFALVISVISLFALTRPWKRPSNELLWQLLLLVMPIGGYVAMDRDYSKTWMLFVALTILCVFVGIRWRLRVPFVAAAIAVTIAAIDMKLPWPLEIQLIAGGAISLAAAMTITRMLRGRTSGFVLDIPQQSDIEALMIAGGQAIMPVHAAGGGAPQVTPQGGEFGGAGASGNF